MLLHYQSSLSWFGLPHHYFPCPDNYKFDSWCCRNAFEVNLFILLNCNKLSSWVTGLICFWEEGRLKLKLREDLRLAIPLQLVLCTQIFFLWLTLIADCIGLIVKQCDSSIYIIERIIHIVQRLPQCNISLCLGDHSSVTICCDNWDRCHWWGRRWNSQSVNPTQLQNASGIGNYLYRVITMLYLAISYSKRLRRQRTM